MKSTESLLSPAQKAALILALTEHVESECKSIDMEQRFREMLDECYPEVSVGNATFSPSRVLEELDPTAFRCGVSDFSDSGNVVEIEGEYYDSDEVDTAREGFVADLQTELDSAQEELDAQEADESTDAKDVAEARAAVELLEEKIAAVESHSF